MNLNNYRLGTKLGMAFAIVVALTLALGGFAISQLSRINANVEDLAGNWLPSVKVLGELQDTANQFRRLQANHVMAMDTKEMDGIEREMAGIVSKFESLLKTYAPMVTDGEERRAYETLAPAYKATGQAHVKLLKLSRGGEQTHDEAKAIYRGESRETFRAMSAVLSKLVEINAKGADGSYDNAKTIYGQSRTWVIVALVIAAGIATALAFCVTRLITQPIAQAVKAAQQIAEGDLTHSLRIDGSDEISQLLNTLNAMTEKLSEIVGTVRTNADNVALASAEIAQGNQDLSQRTEQQASALEETAASMEELGSTVTQNAENAKQGNQLAMGASSVAVKGGQVVGQVVETMKGINDSSKRIVDIISVIDGIAFQTNILALNAAVEAARAGEQGRGFAVVASEVRSLAQRSADAAKEIKSLISTSVERVESGTALVDQAGATMQEVVNSIRRVTDIMGEISSASSEQSSGVAQVGEAVTQMDQTTQQNAALVEQSAAAAESLRQQALHLVQTVSFFKLR
ncbi:methyl-accepting chemotaxis protein [Roseateles koreensis]|uniref:Methyl-accepting chemotaxis protein n=1 Tax=Roseateles koreensis TaxID=2987526 RepID=A0ABT5KLN5_9BURK|nr:methyl-accepting chemotaxis protein [Roseateles koreensis]MDC8783825.1 methyl-accepting chemotaxis protein [Roseateles koreensis]